MKIDLRRRGIAIAIMVSIIIPLALGLMFYPPAHMELRNMPFGLLSLDEGKGETNLGNELIASIESGNFASAPGQVSVDDEDNMEASIADILAFRVFSTQDELDQALESNEIYGAFVISPSFTENQMKALAAAQMGASGGALTEGKAPSAADPKDESSDPAITVVLDYAKSPLVVTQLESRVSGVLSALGVEVAIDVINQGPAAGAGGANMLSGMLSQMMVIMPLLICSMLGGAFSVLGFGVRSVTSAADRARRLGLCAMVDAFAALVVSLMTYWLLTCVAGLPVEFGSYVGYSWLASFFLMVFFSGCACIRGRVAIGTGVLILLLGMTSGYLPFEGLPVFWQDWVCPWAPQYYVGNGLREVIFAGRGIWNQGTVTCGIYALAGIVLACIGIAAGSRSGRSKAASK